LALYVFLLHSVVYNYSTVYSVAIMLHQSHYYGRPIE